MDPRKRTLLRVAVVDEARDAIGDTIDRLMGNKPEARFAFIQERAAFADGAELDICVGFRSISSVPTKPSLRAQRSNPAVLVERGVSLDCFASLGMTVGSRRRIPEPNTPHPRWRSSRLPCTSA